MTHKIDITTIPIATSVSNELTVATTTAQVDETVRSMKMVEKPLGRSLLAPIRTLPAAAMSNPTDDRLPSDSNSGVSNALEGMATMGGNANQKQFRIGFMSTVGDSQSGFIGGLLVTNHLGRPLEFQCTTPVKPNSSQQILYGPTLVPYILADLIGKTLIDKATVKPELVLCD